MGQVLPFEQDGSPAYLGGEVEGGIERSRAPDIVTVK
jgi:hypothetical protein